MSPRRLTCCCLLLAPLFGCGQVSRSHNAQGVKLYTQGDLAQAAIRFQQAAQVAPNNADSYYNLAAVYHRSGKQHNRPEDLQQAENYYHWAIARAPNHRDAHRGLAVLLADAGREAEAYQLLQNWTARDVRHPDARIELARLSEELGRKQLAKEHLMSALIIDPQEPRALTALGRLREDEGDVAQAMANYRKSLELNRFQPEVARRLTDLQSRSILASQPNGGFNSNAVAGVPPRTATLPPAQPR